MTLRTNLDDIGYSLSTDPLTNVAFTGIMYGVLGWWFHPFTHKEQIVLGVALIPFLVFVVVGVLVWRNK